MSIERSYRLEFLVVIILIAFSISLQAQNMNISGKVIAEDNTFLSGANVVLNNGEYATVSNSKGEFHFNDLPAKDYQLTITFLGYKDFTTIIKSGQISENIQFKMNIDPSLISEVEVSENKNDLIQRTESSNVIFADLDFLNKNSSENIVKSLDRLPGINTMEIGNGITKPVIRGMSFNRVVVAQNGVKQEGQQWSAHHGVEVDESSVQKVEIIKGPASLRYGSDAIGGVLNIISDQIPDQDNSSGELAFSGNSGYQLLGVSGRYSIKQNEFFLSASSSYNSFGDINVPADSFEYKPNHYAPLNGSMINTAGRETSGTIHTGLIKDWGNTGVIITNNNHKTGFFAMASGEELVNFNLEEHTASSRDILLPSQNMNHFSATQYTNYILGANKLRINLAYQNNLSSEYNRLYDISGNRTEDLKYYKDNLDLCYNLSTYSAGASLMVRNLRGQIINIGIDHQYQVNSTGGFNHLLPEYTRQSTGVYLINKYYLSKKWIVNGGIRFDYGKILLEETMNPDPDMGAQYFNHELERTYPSFTFSTGINHIPGEESLIKLNIGKSFRMPSAYELGSYGIHKHTLRFEKGDADLKPEQSYQLDLTLEVKKRSFSYSISPFVNFFDNYIYLAPTPDFALGTFTGQVYEYKQNKAFLAGGELTLGCELSKKISLETSNEYVYAVNLDYMSSLPYIAPYSNYSGLYYTLKNNNLGVEVQSVAAQRLTAINEPETDGYSLINLVFTSNQTIGKQELVINIRINNVLNKVHLNHLSYYRRLQIPEMGRNVQINLRLPLNFNSNSKSNEKSI